MSSDKSEEEEHDAISKQIVDYYKKFSQSKHLPKYFSGTSLSYMPPIVREEEVTPKPTPIIVVDDTCSKTLTGAEEAKPVSPTSSVASNRKLEWDNGADIGYSNYQKSTNLHKSVSLPILLTEEHKVKSAEPKLGTQVVTIISYPSSDEIKDTQTSSSSTSYKAQPHIESSSSSGQTKNASTSSSNSSTMAYLKSRIGSPDAASTPVLSSETRKLKKRVVTLCVTKPITIECAVTKKDGSDKIIQTSLQLENASKSIQTSLEVVIEPPQREPQKPENQSVVVVNYDSESEKHTCSSTTQTAPEVVVDSFEYYKDEKGSNSDSPLLGQLIAKKQSNSLIGDVDRSIEILQKLLKSKKYDAVTKKRYIKKIVDKLVETKYNEDSTTSSELFVPKSQPQIKESKFSVKTFREEFLPDGDRTSEAVTSLEKQPSSGSYHSWKEDKTDSERLLEQRGQGDHIVKFAKKERQHQLAWISDEISHLTKLKGLLEKKVQRTTTVYMVSNPDCNCCPKPRNYVIETELSSSSASSAVPTDYNLYDKNGKHNYKVRSSNEDNNHRIGEIEVVSDNGTTNIKVKTARREEDSKGSTGGKFDTFPRSKGEGGRRCTCRMRKTEDDDHITVEIPIISAAQFASEINTGLDTHAPSSSTCRCGSVKNYKTSPTTSDGSKPNVLTAVDPRRVCYCCGRQKSTAGGLDVCSCCKGSAHKLSRNEWGGGTTETEGRARGSPKKRKIIKKKSYKPVYKNKFSEPPGTTDDQSKSVVDKPDDGGQKSIAVTSQSKPDAEGGKTYRLEQNDDLPNEKYVLIPLDKEDVVGNQGVASDRNSIHTLTSHKSGDNRYFTLDKKDEPADQNYPLEAKKVIYFDNINGGDSKLNRETQYDQEKSTADAQTCTCKKERKCCKCGKHASTDTDSGTPVMCQSCFCDEAAKNKSAAVQTSIIDLPTAQYASTNVQTCFCDEKELTETLSSSTSTSTSASATSGSCACCKRKDSASQRLYRLKRRLSDETFPLCRPCYRQNRSVFPPRFYNPGHVCNCYSVVQTGTLNEIKKTIKDLNELEEFCRCSKSDNRSAAAQYCDYCKCKLKRTSRNQNGIAYMLTFENEPVNEDKVGKKDKSRYLEEIKIKIPVIAKKRHKDKENKKKKDREDDRRGSSSESSRKRISSLQEYLCQNRPGFVEEAEGRRKTVNNSRAHREEMADYNKLQFLKKCQEEDGKNPKRLFSGKEMKEITKRNYKRLPEVQQRLQDNRERQLRQASRLMADTFNRKLRENVLKGKKDLPTNCRIICL